MSEVPPTRGAPPRDLVSALLGDAEGRAGNGTAAAPPSSTVRASGRLGAAACGPGPPP